MLAGGGCLQVSRRTPLYRILTAARLVLWGFPALALSAIMVRLGLALAAPSLTCADLVTDSQDQFRYMARAGRCEGLYIRKHSGGGSLMLLSLTERAAAASQMPSNTMELTWPSRAPNGVPLEELSIRAAADPAGRHYRMDATQRFSAGSFQWPLDVLKGAGIQERAVHLMGFARTKIGSVASQLLYAPLRRGTRSEAATAYEFTLHPSANVNDMKYVIQTLGVGGWSAASPARASSFGVGAAQRPFTVSIPRSEFPPGASVSRVNFSVKLGDKSDPEPANCIVVFFND